MRSAMRYHQLRDEYVRSGDQSALDAMLRFVHLDPLPVPAQTSAERAVEQEIQRRVALRLTAARWWNWLMAILLLCLLGLMVAWGINWLSHQPWGGGDASFTCTDGGTLTWHSLKDGDILIHCR